MSTPAYVATPSKVGTELSVVIAMEGASSKTIPPVHTLTTFGANGWKSRGSDDKISYSDTISASLDTAAIVEGGRDINEWASAYGTLAVNSTQRLHCVWNLMINNKNNNNNNTSAIVGITSKPTDDQTPPFHRDRYNINYAYRPDNQEKLCKYDIQDYGDDLSYEFFSLSSIMEDYDELEMKEDLQGLIVTVDLNLIKGTLSFWVNGEYQGKAYDVVRRDGIKYTLACSLNHKESSVMWLNARCMTPDDDATYVGEQYIREILELEEKTEEETDKQNALYKEIVTKLEEETDKQNALHKEIVTKLEDEVRKEYNLNRAKQNEIIKYIKNEREMKKEKQKSEQQIADLKSKLKKERDSNRNFSNKLKKMKNEKQKTEQQIADLEDEGRKEYNLNRAKQNEIIKYIKNERQMKKEKQKAEQQIADLKSKLKKETDSNRKFSNKLKKESDLNKQKQAQIDFYIRKEKELQKTVSNLLKKEKDLKAEISRVRLKSLTTPLLFTSLARYSGYKADDIDEKNNDNDNDNKNKNNDNDNDEKNNDNDNDKKIDNYINTNLSVVKYLPDPHEGVWGLMKKWYSGDIDSWGFIKIMGEKIIESGFEKFGSWAGATIGGSAAGALGIHIGGIPATLIGIALGWLLGQMLGGVAEWMYNALVPPEETHKQKIMRAALEFLGYEPKDVYRPSKFNEKELKKRFRQLALQKHPDNFLTGSHEKFIELNKHYEVLKKLFPSKYKNVADDNYDSYVSALNSFISSNKTDGYSCLPTITGMIEQPQWNGKSLQLSNWDVNFLRQQNMFSVKALNTNNYLESLSLKPSNLLLNMMFK